MQFQKIFNYFEERGIFINGAMSRRWHSHWPPRLLVKINTTTFEGNMTNHYQDVTSERTITLTNFIVQYLDEEKYFIIDL